MWTRQFKRTGESEGSGFTLPGLREEAWGLDPWF